LNGLKKYLWENSLFLQNIDKFIFISILSVFFTSIYFPSDIIGFTALITVFLTILKFVFNPSKNTDKFNNFEVWLIAYFMVVVITLAGSTLFHLSLKGFFKTFTYISFYFSIAYYLKSNRDKIPYLLGAIGLCAGYEAIFGILQNFSHVSEISTWQDISNLNPEQVMTRVYGTLKPLNPNLLGGYLVVSFPSLFALSAYFLSDKKYKLSALFSSLALITVITLFLTGCRGAYIAAFAMFVASFLISAKFFWNEYKKIYLTVIGVFCILITAALMFLTSLRARVLSIFAMRQDSSNSFRFNVYHSSIDMFKDNWLLGIGIGNQNFREIYGLYMRTGFDALSSYNIYLETAVESGIFALIAFLGFLISFFKKCINIIKQNTDVKTLIFVSCALISVTGVCIHGLVDTVFFRPQIQFIFWTMIAVVSCI